MSTFVFSVPVFNPGKKSPPKTKRRHAKHLAENRKSNFKRGIDVDLNRRLRSSIGKDATKLNKKKTIIAYR
jgi:hypothetical protein